MLERDFIENWMHCGTLLSAEKGQLILGWGARKWLKEPSQDHPSFYFPDYFLEDSTPWFMHEHVLKLTDTQLLGVLEKIPDSCKKHVKWESPSRDFFHTTFMNLQEKIANGELKKAVPFVLETASESMDKARLMHSLKYALRYIQSNAAYLYGFWNDEEGILGVTPEVLFQYGSGHEKVLQTMACAGTKNVKEGDISLLEDAKEIHEHELVVHGIVQSLSPYGNVNVGKLQLLKLSQLMHLVTPLNVRLHDEPLFKEIVEALHPTPAVGAFPKKEGYRWLQEEERKMQRYRYGAPAGYWLPDEKQSSCYVSIRNVQWKEQRMFIGAGCGVIADSICENEWAEVELKLKAIKEMLDL